MVSSKVSGVDRLLHIAINDYPTTPEKITSILAAALIEINELESQEKASVSREELAAVRVNLFECIRRINRIELKKS